MGSVTDRAYGTEQATPAPARTRTNDGVDAPEPSARAALAGLQSTAGNQSVAALVGGQAPDAVLASVGIAPAQLGAAPDGAGSPVATDAGVGDASAGQPAGGVPDAAQPTAPDAAQPAAPDAAEPTPHDAAEPTTPDAAEPTAEPATHGAAEPATHDAAEPAARTGGTEGGSQATAADAGPAGHPAANATGHPAADRAGHPATEPTGHPATDRAGAPAQEHAVEGAPAATEATGAEELDTTSLNLIDEELVEHERWAEAGAAVGGAGSEERAAFIAGEVGGGVGEGFGSGFVMGLVATIGIQALDLGLEEVAGVAIPGVGQVVGGVMSAYALAAGWKKDTAAIGKMGEGRSGYEEAANDIEGICAILDLASNIVNVIAGLVGIVAVASAAAALLTLGALSPFAIAAGAIATAVGVAGMILGLVKMALQPLVILFRSLHAFTSQADPREIEAQGRVLEEGGKEMGGALGGLAGAAVAGTARGEPEEATAGQVEEPPAPAATPGPGGREPLVVEAEPIPGQRPLELDSSGTPIGGEPLEPHPVAPAEGPTPALETGGGPVPPEQQPQLGYGEVQLPEAGKPPARPLENLTEAEIDQTVNAPPRGEPTPADFTDADIDALVGRLDNPAQLESPEFAMSGPVGPDVIDPVTGQVRPASGLSNMTIEGQNVNPNQIGYHENAYFQGIKDVREIDAFPTGPNPELPGPAGAPVPQTEVRVTGPSPGPGQPRPVLSSETGGNVEVRYHGPNPNAPEGSFSQENPTVQVDTPNERFPWEGEPVDASAGERANVRSTPAADGLPTTGRYRTDDGQWLRLPTPEQRAAYAAGTPMPAGVATPEQVASMHYPVYGEPAGPLGGGAPPIPEGTPPAPGGGPLADEAALETTAPAGSGRAGGRTSDVDWDDPRVRSALGLDPVTGKPTGATLSGPGQLTTDPNTASYDPTNPGTTGPYRGELGQMKGGEYAPEGYFEVSEGPGYAVRAGAPGAWVDHVFPTLEEAQAYARSLAGSGEAAIRETSALPHGWPADASGKVYPGNAVDAVRVYEVPPGTPMIRSVVAPQPEGSPAWGRPNVYGGGGPQVQLPKDLFPRGPAGGRSPAQIGPEFPVTERAEGWYTRLQQYPGAERAAALREQAEGLEWAEIPENAHRAELAGVIVEHARKGAEEPGEGEGTGPVVEAVNPRYPSPPGSRQQLDQLTRDINRLLAARAQAGQREQRAAQVERAAQAQTATVAVAQHGAAESLAATQEHQGQVKEREQANQQSAQHHEEGGAKLAETGSKLAGVATLETLLAGWSGFTGLVLRFESVLPDRAVNAFRKMNSDSTEFMAKLVHIKTGVADQGAQQGPRGAEIQATGTRIAATGQQAQGTAERFTQIQQQGTDLARVNQQDIALAEKDRARAATNQGRADSAATDLTQRRQSLAEQMTVWAQQHRQARQQAVEETARRLRERRLNVTKVPEG